MGRLHDRPSTRSRPRDRLGPGGDGALARRQPGATTGEVCIEDRDEVESSSSEISNVVGPADEHLAVGGKPRRFPIAESVHGHTSTHAPTPRPVPARPFEGRSRSPRRPGIARVPRRRRIAPTLRSSATCRGTRRTQPAGHSCGRRRRRRTRAAARRGTLWCSLGARARAEERVPPGPAPRSPRAPNCAGVVRPSAATGRPPQRTAPSPTTPRRHPGCLRGRRPRRARGSRERDPRAGPGETPGRPRSDRDRARGRRRSDACRRRRRTVRPARRAMFGSVRASNLRAAPRRGRRTRRRPPGRCRARAPLPARSRAPAVGCRGTPRRPRPRRRLRARVRDGAPTVPAPRPRSRPRGAFPAGSLRGRSVAVPRERSRVVRPVVVDPLPRRPSAASPARARLPTAPHTAHSPTDTTRAQARRTIASAIRHSSPSARVRARRRSGRAPTPEPPSRGTAPAPVSRFRPRVQPGGRR